MSDTLLLLQFGDLGDTLLTIPAIRAIRRRFPAARLILMGKAAPAQLVLDLGLVDSILAVDKHRYDRPRGLLDPRGVLALVRLCLRLRRERISTCVLFHHLVTRWGALKYALLFLACGASRKLGVDNGRGWFLTESVRDRGFGAAHESEYWLEVAALLGARGEPSLEVPVDAADRATARRLLAPVEGRRFLAVHPGTGWYGPGRLWHPERFAAAARLLRDRHGLAPVIVGTRQDESPGRVMLSHLDGPFLDLIGQTSVGELAAILEQCDLLIANDGGVAHLSAAVGTPVVAVFGPSNDRAWRPLVGEIVAADLPCRPCFYRDYERGLPAGCATRECMDLVTPEMVADRAVRSRSRQRSTDDAHDVGAAATEAAVAG